MWFFVFLTSDKHDSWWRKNVYWSWGGHTTISSVISPRHTSLQVHKLPWNPRRPSAFLEAWKSGAAGDGACAAQSGHFRERAHARGGWGNHGGQQWRRRHPGWEGASGSNGYEVSLFDIASFWPLGGHGSRDQYGRCALVAGPRQELPTLSGALDRGPHVACRI